jgi:hypothetical protein
MTDSRRKDRSEEARWHWAEGNKYALEAARALLLLNGASAISILTYLGNVRPHKHNLLIAIFLLSLGAGSATFIFLLGYIAQLYYGNQSVEEGTIQSTMSRQLAVRWHKACYAAGALAVIFFVVGIAVAVFGLPKNQAH